MNLFNMVNERSYSQLERLISKAREVDVHDPLSDDMKDVTTNIIVGSCDWNARPAHEAAREFIFPPRRRFYMDGFMGKTFEDTPILECRDTGDLWNGWRVPAPTYRELLDYAEQVRAYLGGDTEEWSEFMVGLMEMYGGQSDEEGTGIHSAYGWCWSLAPQYLEDDPLVS